MNCSADLACGSRTLLKMQEICNLNGDTYPCFLLYLQLLSWPIHFTLDNTGWFEWTSMQASSKNPAHTPDSKKLDIIRRIWIDKSRYIQAYLSLQSIRFHQDIFLAEESLEPPRTEQVRSAERRAPPRRFHPTVGQPNGVTELA